MTQDNRSARREVRNPVLGLPAARAALESLTPREAAALEAVLDAIGADAALRAEQSWRKHKAPMASYWKAAGVYSRHIAKAIRFLRKEKTPLKIAA